MGRAADELRMDWRSHHDENGGNDDGLKSATEDIFAENGKCLVHNHVAE